MCKLGGKKQTFYREVSYEASVPFSSIQYDPSSAAEGSALPVPDQKAVGRAWLAANKTLCVTSRSLCLDMLVLP